MNAEVPTAALPVPLMLRLPADAPTKVFCPPKLCKNGTPPSVSTPTEAEAVLGSARFPLSVTVPAEKLLEPSLRTIALAVLTETALETTVVPGGPVNSPARLGNPEPGHGCPLANEMR